MSRSDCTFTSPRAAIRIQRIKTILAIEPRTAKQLAERLHCSKPLALIYLTYLREQPHRCVRVVDHARQRCGRVEVFGLGSEPDAVPIILTRAERDAARVDTPEKREAHLAKRREYHRKLKASKPRTAKKSRAMYDPPLIQQVANLIAERPRYTTGQIAITLGVEPSAVSTAANRLEREGKVAHETNGTSSRKRWVSKTKPPVKHGPASVPKQGIFAALGI